MQRRDFVKSIGLGLISSLLSCESESSCTSSSRTLVPAPKKISLEDIEFFRETINDYKYGQFNILNTGLKAFHLAEARQLLLHPFYHYDNLYNEGSCCELMNHAYLDLKKMRPHYYFFRACGSEPYYFSDEPSSHYFLVIAPRNVLASKDKVYRQKELSDILRSYGEEMVLVDPSFKRVGWLAGSGYSIFSLINQGVPLSYSNTLRLYTDFDVGVPLFFGKDDEMVFLCLDPEKPSRFIFGFQNKKSTLRLVKLYSREMFWKEKNDSVLEEFADFFRKQEVVEASQEPPDETKITIL